MNGVNQIKKKEKCSKRGTTLKDALESNFTIEFAVLTIANTVQVILKRHITVHYSSFHLRQLRPDRHSVS